MHDIGLDDYVIEIGDVRAKLLEEKFINLVKNQYQVIKKIKSYRIKAKNERNFLIELLQGRK